MTGHTIVQPRGLGLPGLLINRQKRPGPHVAAGLAFDQYLESGSLGLYPAEEGRRALPVRACDIALCILQGTLPVPEGYHL